MGVPHGGYLVAAGHVAKDLEDGAFDIRLNESYNLRKHGQKHSVARLQHIDEVHWYFHPTDATVDVAVIPYELPTWADNIWLGYKSILSEFTLWSKAIGAGDFAYVVGVLHFMHGTARNMPAVHTGHIVLMPDDEKIPIDDWRSKRKKAPPIEADAYLVQATALPGSSGSPVFARRSLETMLDLPEIQKPDPLVVSIPGSLWLL